MVEWIFAFETRRIVSRSKIDNVVDDIVKLLEYAKGFPQEHLMSAGQLLLKFPIDKCAGAVKPRGPDCVPPGRLR